MTEAHIHPTACVEEGVNLGRGVRIWHNAHVRSGAEIGDDVMVGKGVYIDAGVKVGARCKIQNNALLYKGCELSDGVFVGPGAILTNDPYPRAVNPDLSLKSDDDWSVGRIHVGEGASIGAAAVIVPGLRIGSWALVGAASLVRENIAPHALVVGVPSRRVGSVCRCGYPCQRCEECGWSEDLEETSTLVRNEAGTRLLVPRRSNSKPAETRNL